MPRALRNRGNFVISLGDLCQWLASQAEALGVSVLPGFAATDVLYDGERVAGVVTGDLGVARDGSRKASYQPGYELRAKYTVFAEGCRGHLGRRLEARFGLRASADPQHYGLGFKEIWQIDAAKHRPGEVVHTLGWPLDAATDGGGFVYHAAAERVYVGFIVSLGYRNPHLDPFAEFQRWKQHPAIRELLAAGERISYGARAVNKGGLQSLPKLTFPGGVLVGCEAGFLNPAKIKGSHTAMKSGMLAAETIFAALAQDGAAADAELARLRRARPRLVALGRARPRPQLQRRHREARLVSRRRARVRRAERARRACAVDAAQSRRGSRALARRRGRAAAAVSEARRRRVVRSRELRVPVEHRARGGSAVSSRARGPGRADRREPAAL